jgi:hypothetical protein
VRAVEGLLLTREEADAVAGLARLGVGVLRYRNGAVPATAIRLVEVLAEFGRRTPAGQVSGMSETVNLASGADLPCSGPRIGVTAAAERLSVSAQTVRRFCRRGDLTAWRTPAGAWTIDSRSATALAGRRAAEEARDHATEAQAV